MEPIHTEIELKKLVLNTGQIEGLPANPRKIDVNAFSKLKENITYNPEMLALRGLIVYELGGSGEGFPRPPRPQGVHHIRASVADGRAGDAAHRDLTLRGAGGGTQCRGAFAHHKAGSERAGQALQEGTG